jgi:hypothetical protein
MEKSAHHWVDCKFTLLKKYDNTVNTVGKYQNVLCIIPLHHNQMSIQHI